MPKYDCHSGPEGQATIPSNSETALAASVAAEEHMFRDAERAF